MSQRSPYFLCLTTPKTVELDETDFLFLNFHKKLNIRQKNLNSSCPYKHEEKIICAMKANFNFSFIIFSIYLDH